MTSSPCRLTVFLARGRPLAAVLRRGPTAWSRLSLWHTDSDVIEHGQWLHGRVFERRCDLSPDGSLFFYFVRTSGGRPRDFDSDSWAALSRAPWFKALALWEIGTTYFAGGYFHGPRKLFAGGISDAPDRGMLPRWLSLTGDVPHVDRSPDWTDRTVFVSRLLRNGWEPDSKPEDPGASWMLQEPGGTRRLLMTPAPGKRLDERHQVEYAVLDRAEIEPIGPATWAGWDHRRRLIVARDGRLLEWRGEEDLGVIADFNDAVPDPQPAPPEAENWPRAL